MFKTPLDVSQQLNRLQSRPSCRCKHLVLCQDLAYCYEYNIGSSKFYSYSDKTINLIMDQIKKGPEHVVQDLKDKVGKSTPGAKEF